MSKVILITGANAGIGFELTRLLAEKGHTVYLSARNEAAGKEAAEKLQKEGLKNVKFLLLDVTKLPTIEAAKATIEQAEGYIDILVNNAAIGKITSDQNATTVAVDTIREVLDTNLYGAIQTTQTLLPLVRKAASGPGVIINVSSGLGSNAYQARPGAGNHLVGYNTSKAALNSYSIALAHALEGEGIKVNAVTPGYLATGLNHFAAGAKDVGEGSRLLVPLILVEKEGPTGRFFGASDGKEFPW